MKTENIILTGIGILIGYGLYKKYQDNQLAKRQTTLVETTPSKCEEKFVEYAKTVRPASAEAFETMKTTWIKNCQAKA